MLDVLVNRCPARLPIGERVRSQPARYSSPFTRGLQILFLAGLMIPPQIYLIPIVRIFRALHLIGTFYGLLLIFTGGGLLSFAVFVTDGDICTLLPQIVAWGLKACNLFNPAHTWTFWRSNSNTAIVFVCGGTLTLIG